MNRHSLLAVAACGGLAAMAAAPPLLAQDPRAGRDSALAAQVDSLTERLESLDERVRRMARELDAQQQTRVTTRSGRKLELSGMLLVNGYFSNARVNSADIPGFVVDPQDTTGLPNAYLGAQVRQSRLGLTVSGMQALGAMVTGDIQLDFYGGQPGGSVGRTFPVPRIRTAVIRLDWRSMGLLVGQESQLISPLNPVTFAAVGVPGFTYSGNLWFWIPQARFTWQSSASRPLRLGLQAAALAPTLSLSGATLSTASSPDSAEKSQRPMAQGRAYVSWGYGETESTIGAAIHRGWVATTGDSLLSSEAVSVDARLNLGAKLSLQLEAFSGTMLAGLGAGGIGQSFGTGNLPVDSRGGWAQLDLRPSATWQIGGGVGFDDPDDADLPATARLKNMVVEGHLHWRPGGGLLAGVEYRRIETTYAAGKLAANHINGFVGLSF